MPGILSQSHLARKTAMLAFAAADFIILTATSTQSAIVNSSCDVLMFYSLSNTNRTIGADF
jgi:hypothetical protein